MTTAAKPREITLPECPRCGHVGKMPDSSWGGRDSCVGQPGTLHAKTKKVPTLWRKVEEAAA
jgi:hypothetical protein